MFSSLFYDAGDDLSSQDLDDIESSLDIPHRVLDRLAQDEQRNLRIIQRTEQTARMHRRTILFAASVRNANLHAEIGLIVQLGRHGSRDFVEYQILTSVGLVHHELAA